jgi:hypothetical protein
MQITSAVGPKVGTERQDLTPATNRRFTENVKTNPLFIAGQASSPGTLQQGATNPERTKQLLAKISFQGQKQKDKEKKAILRM